eukprot:NODE_7000_length_801_cov_86.687316_g6763_i0.p1 GENE.NODE_7000_length_801_cov_86.687316_g6763_i0~~NODE_7000_length_801_cov_86.687316_g6763_i0.p1  ORF type:complete len:155 (+),score=9.06 NODE_7000_length_801_cov_86.687316_g6763_i0:72-536(+)
MDDPEFHQVVGQLSTLNVDDLDDEAVDELLRAAMQVNAHLKNEEHRVITSGPPDSPVRKPTRGPGYRPAPQSKPSRLPPLGSNYPVGSGPARKAKERNSRIAQENQNLFKRLNGVKSSVNFNSAPHAGPQGTKRSTARAPAPAPPDKRRPEWVD